jgi:uncharacterized protein YbaP (TraB family)
MPRSIATRIPALLVAGLALWPIFPSTVAAQGAGDVTPTDRPFLWMIDGPVPSFLYGTMHVPDPRVTSRPDIVHEALSKSDRFYTEIPMDEATQARAQMMFMLPAGQTLSQILPSDLYQRADAYLKTKGYAMMFFEQMKVYGLITIISVIDYLQDLMTQKPLDVLLYQEALALGQEVGALETIDEQMGVFEGFTVKEQVQLLEDSLDHLEKLQAEDPELSPVQQILDAYVSGDAEKLTGLMYEYVDVDDALGQKFLRLLLVERNARMAERIDTVLEESPNSVHFIAVGALHYPLKDGILSRLRRKGYRVIRLDADDLDVLRDRFPAAVGAAD